MRGVLVALALLAGTVTVIAQQADPVPVDGVSQWFDLSSIAGVVGATGLAVQGLKRALRNVPLAALVPVWVYSVSVAFGLTWAAHSVFLSLHGDLIHLAIQAVMGALMASGAYETVRHGVTKPIGAAGASRTNTARDGIPS